MRRACRRGGIFILRTSPRTLPATSARTRERLREVGHDYPYSMYGRWRAFCATANALGAKIKAGSYQSFRTYLHLLHRLGLVERELRPIGRLTCPYCGREIPRLPPDDKEKKGEDRARPLLPHTCQRRRPRMAEALSGALPQHRLEKEDSGGEEEAEEEIWE